MISNTLHSMSQNLVKELLVLMKMEYRIRRILWIYRELILNQKWIREMMTLRGYLRKNWIILLWSNNSWIISVQINHLLRNNYMFCWLNIKSSSTFGINYCWICGLAKSIANNLFGRRQLMKTSYKDASAYMIDVF